MSKLYDGKLATTHQSARRVSIANYFGIDVVYPERSTLNEHLKHIDDIMPSGSEKNTLKYLAIGDRGHGVEIDDNGIADPKPIRHLPTHSGAYGLRPLVLRPIDNDLSDVQRRDYAFRIRIEIAGRQYWAYYIKRIDMRGVVTKDELTVKDGDETTTIAFRYTDAELYPQPPKLKEYDYETEDKIEIPDGRYVKTSADITIRFTAFDIAEYQNVARIMRGDPGNATISEIFLCSGVDKPHTGESTTGSPFTYDDAYGVQIAYSLSLYTNLAITDEKSTFTFNIGQSVPVFLGV